MIGIIGGEFFAGRLVQELRTKTDAKIVSTDLRDPDLVEKAKDSEIIHYIFSPIVTLGGLRTVQRLRKKNKKIVVHWIGTDVYNAITRLKSKFITKRYKHLVDVHLAQHSRLVRELDSVGVNCEELPLPTFGLYSLYPMPTRKKILVYMPESRGDFYGKPILDRVFDSFPESDFIVLPNSGKDINKANVTCISWTDDMEKIYRDVAVFIRLPVHEGMPNTVIEALSMGRYAICSFDFPYCEQARSLEEVKTKLMHLLQKSSLNQEGSDYVHKTYNKTLLTEQLLQIYEQI